MFNRLQQKWKVSGKRFWLIMSTFAITGSSTAWLTRKITEWAGVEKYAAGWWILKISVLLIGYQILILFFGFLLGQFGFFWNYEKKILKKLLFSGFLGKKSIKIAVFASGKGSNFEKLITHFQAHPRIKISLLLTNNPKAGALQIANENNIPSKVIDKADLAGGIDLAEILSKQKVDFLILAGFLKKIPPGLINAYRGRILNIHPALLPKFGGKGMYGSKVHEAVIAAGEKKSGITIHLVDEHYDNGDIIFQASCPVGANDSPESLAVKIHALEHAHFPSVIEKYIQMQKPG